MPCRILINEIIIAVFLFHCCEWKLLSAQGKFQLKICAIILRTSSLLKHAIIYDENEREGRKKRFGMLWCHKFVCKLWRRWCTIVRLDCAPSSHSSFPFLILTGLQFSWEIDLKANNLRRKARETRIMAAVFSEMLFISYSRYKHNGHYTFVGFLLECLSTFLFAFTFNIQRAFVLGRQKTKSQKDFFSSFLRCQRFVTSEISFEV